MKKVLIIDDAKDICAALKHILVKMNYEVITAYDGLDGWSKIIKHQPHIILLDLHMPFKDGLEILKELEEEWLGIPVIIITGDESKDIKNICSLLGVKAYLNKPIIPNDLEDAILKISA